MSDSKSTYAFEPTPQWTTVNPKPFPLFRTHSEDLEKPPLPSPPRNEQFNDRYTVSTHLVPAACPRSTPDIPLPVLPEYATNTLEWKRNIQQLAAQIIERQERFAVQGNLGGERSEKLLWNCVNRYVKRVPDGRNGLTLFLAHANGFPKEVWETTLRYLLSSSSTSLIDEVWSWEAVQHGDAALVNETNLSGIFDWRDNARDIAHFLIHYLPEDASSKVLPTHLHLLPETIIEYRKTKGFSSRSLVAVAHSFGGCSSIIAAVNFPALFSSMILVDPAVIQNDVLPSHFWDRLATTLARRNHWPSREEALRSFKASPFFGTWHPDILRLYVTYGIYEDPEGGVKLKTSGLHEALVYADLKGKHEAWELLERLDERIELRWVVPGKPTDKGLMGEQATRVRVWRRPVNSSNVVIYSAGHLIAQESPEELSKEISAFLEKKYGVRSRAYL